MSLQEITYNLQRSSLGRLDLGLKTDQSLQSGGKAPEAETTVHDNGDVDRYECPIIDGELRG